MVVREYNARGPVTDLLTGIFAINNLVCLVTFSAAVAAIQLVSRPEAGIYRSLFPLFWQLIGSAAAG